MGTKGALPSGGGRTASESKTNIGAKKVHLELKKRIC